MRCIRCQPAGAVLAAFLVLVFAGAARAQTVSTFSNTAVIVIPDNANATPFPSNITVSGMTGVVTHVRVKLNQISHTNPLDLTVWVRSANGAIVPLLARPVTSQFSSTNLEFDDCAPRTLYNPGFLIDTTPALPSGRYRPGIYPFTGPTSMANPTGLFHSLSLSYFNGPTHNGTWSLYVRDNSANGAAGAIAGGWSVTIYTQPTHAVTGLGLTGPSCAKPDYDGDGRADMTVYRPVTGEWFVLQSSTGTGALVGWGAPSSTGAGDVAVPADYDGDGQTDMAVYRETTGQWFIRFSQGGLASVDFGAPSSMGLGDMPVPADYDGDGLAEIAIYRQTSGTWFVRHTNGAGVTTHAWGTPGFGDYPGR